MSGDLPPSDRVERRQDKTIQETAGARRPISPNLVDVDI